MAEANNSPSAPPLYNPGNHYFIEEDKLHDRPTSAYSPDSSPPQSDEENLDCSKEENLSSQREDLITKFQELRERLDRKQKYMIDCLDDTAIHNETEDLRKQLEHLYMTRRNLEKDMKDPELAHALNVPCRVVDDQICRIEKMLRKSLYVKWNIIECENAIENVCTLREGRTIIDTYKTKKGLLWENIKPGIQRTQVNGPVGMTIEPKTDRIVIADAGNNRLQIFSNIGDHLFEIPLVLNKVVFFSFLGEALFIIGKDPTQLIHSFTFKYFLFIYSIVMRNQQFLITRMDSLDGNTNCKTFIKLDESYNNFFTKPDTCSLFLIDVKKNTNPTLTVCIYKNNHKLRTDCLSYESLEEVQPDGDVEIVLHSPHIKDHTVATCVKVVGLTHKLTNFFVMYRSSPFAVQVFNWNGEMVRGIVDKVNLTNVRSIFLVDQEGHIIICTVKRTFDHKLNKDKQPTESVVQTRYSNYIYSIDDGKRQHKWTCSSVLPTLRRPFRRSLSVGGANARNVVSAAPYFGASMNSRQVLMVLHVPEHSFLLRAF